MITHEKFNNAIIRRYPLLYDVCNICVIGWDGEYSSDIDDVIESFFPELKKICDMIRISYPDVDDANNETVSAVGYVLVRIKIMEWLRYNPEKIKWFLL